MERKSGGKKPSFPEEQGNVNLLAEISDEEFDTVEEAAQQPLRVTYKHPAFRPKHPTRAPRKSTERESSSGGITSFILPPPDAHLWGKIKTEHEELKVKFMAVGDTYLSRIEGWYGLEPITNIRQESEELGIDISDMAYAMKLRPLIGGENEEYEIIITRRVKRPNSDLPRTGTVHLSYPYTEQSFRDSREVSSALHEIRRRTLSNKSFTKRTPNKGKVGQNGAKSNEEDEISSISMDEHQFRHLSSAGRHNSALTDEKEPEETIIRTFQNILSSPKLKCTSKVGKFKKSKSIYSLVNYQEPIKSEFWGEMGNYVCNEWNKNQNLDDSNRKGNNFHFNYIKCIKRILNSFDVICIDYEREHRKNVQHYKHDFKICTLRSLSNSLNAIYTISLDFKYYLKFSILKNFFTYMSQLNGAMAKNGLALVNLRRNILKIKISNSYLKSYPNYKEKCFNSLQIIYYLLSKPIRGGPPTAGKRPKELLQNTILLGKEKNQVVEQISNHENKRLSKKLSLMNYLMRMFVITSLYTLERGKTKIYTETYRNMKNIKGHKLLGNIRICTSIIDTKNLSIYISLPYFLNCQYHKQRSPTKNRFNVLHKQKQRSESENYKQKLFSEKFRTYLKSCIIEINSYNAKHFPGQLNTDKMKSFEREASNIPKTKNKHDIRKCKTNKRKRSHYYYKNLIITNKLKIYLTETEWKGFLKVSGDKRKEKTKKSKKSGGKEKTENSKPTGPYDTSSKESMSSSGYSKGSLSNTSSSKSVSSSKSKKVKAKDVSSKDSVSSKGSKKKAGDKKKESKASKKDSQGGGCCAKKQPKTDEKKKKPPDKEGKLKSDKNTSKPKQIGLLVQSKVSPKDEDSNIEGAIRKEPVLVYKAKPGDKGSDVFGKLCGGPIKLPVFAEPSASIPSSGRSKKCPSQQYCSQRPCRTLGPLKKILCKNSGIPPNSWVVYGTFRAVANHKTGELDICVDENSRNELVDLLSKLSEKSMKSKSGET